jgi:hypothetical protein
MIELECPWCDEPCRVDGATSVVVPLVLRCERCGVEVTVEDSAPAGSELALAA